MPHRRFLAAAAATLLATIGAVALLAELGRTLLHSSATGTSLGATLFGYFRFFTILTNWFVAILAGITASTLWRGRRQPSAAMFRAALVYMLVTGLTYELLLRRLWSPQGLSFWLDLVFHDVQPALTVLFWLAFAPKCDLRWSDLPWIAAYPLVYFALSLLVGALGAG